MNFSKARFELKSSGDEAFFPLDSKGVKPGGNCGGLSTDCGATAVFNEGLSCLFGADITILRFASPLDRTMESNSIATTCSCPIESPTRTVYGACRPTRIRADLSKPITTVPSTNISGGELSTGFLLGAVCIFEADTSTGAATKGADDGVTSVDLSPVQAERAAATAASAR
jgi:hypothetical protein